jgi:hypothetical protein
MLSIRPLCYSSPLGDGWIPASNDQHSCGIEEGTCESNKLNSLDSAVPSLSSNVPFTMHDCM